MKFDYRAGRRLHMRKPAPALFSSMWQVKILDVSTTGLGVEHTGELKPGDNGYIEFTWNGTKFTLACTVVNSRPLTAAELPVNWNVPTLPSEGRVGLTGKARAFRSGLVLKDRENGSTSAYRERVAQHVEKMKDAERTMPSLLPDIDEE